MKKVSVILTTYNSESQLQEVLDSINNQEGKGEIFDLELLVVDDCSVDNTRGILLDNGIKFQVTSKNTGGPNHGRNLALSRCSGDYICIADHDDIWFRDKVKKLLEVSHIAPIITSGYTLFDIPSLRKKNRVSSSKGSFEYLFYKQNETFLSKLRKSKVGQQTYLGSIMFSSVFKHILFEEEIGMVDFDWVLKLFHNQKSVEVCKALYLRRVEGSNLSLNEQYRINDYNYSLKTILSYKDKYPNSVRYSERRINGSMGRYYYLIGDTKLAREYFLKSGINLINLLYLITTFVGSKFVRKHFNIFG